MEENEVTKVTVNKITYEVLMQHFAPDSPNRRKPLTDGTYTATYSGGNPNFIEFSRVNNEPQPELTHEEMVRRYREKKKGGQSDTGWKFHVSVNPNAFGLSCDLIYNVLSDNQVKGFKIANPYSEEFENLLHSGRGITIYAFKEPQRSFIQNDQENNNNLQPWDSVLSQISTTLEEHTIIPGPIAQGNSGGGTNERTLLSTPYITFRYDDRPQNIGGMGKVGSSMDPNADLQSNFIGGLGPHSINENFMLINSQKNNLSEEKTISINNLPNEDTSSYSNYQSINFNNFINREKRKERFKHKTITNNNDEDNTMTSNDEHKWQRSKSPEKDKEKESKSLQQNNQSGESCQSEPKYDNQPKDPDKDHDGSNDKGFKIGSIRGR